MPLTVEVSVGVALAAACVPMSSLLVKEYLSQIDTVGEPATPMCMELCPVGPTEVLRSNRIGLVKFVTPILNAKIYTRDCYIIRIQ